ncbi:MAG TPA: zinc-dependent alcohol dehydrogenase family protein [Candidatus Eremiobacteraceae bacterium]|nr:zinc-dependent alcohol dehydrogenase family protein [Candidatus Eremiobacteraceae bacterium]
MKACLLRTPMAIEKNPLQFTDIPEPKPGAGEVLVRVQVCGVCRTDLHVIEGELPPKLSPIIPGHQVVGTIEETASRTGRFSKGARVGIAWLHKTDGTCGYCRRGEENLCDAPLFTGYTVNGGYAEWIVAPEDFVYPIPEGLANEHAAPLLCAGIIGYRCLRLAQLERGSKLGFYGFGAAAHVAIQVARYWGVDVYVSTRDARHQTLAKELGAKWSGGTLEAPPEKLDAVIVFAPAGEIVPAALKAVRKGGRLILGGIHMSDIPSFPYDLLYQERTIRSVANNTREDGRQFLKLAAEIPVRTHIQLYPLRDANLALNALKTDAISGAAVLQVRS